MRRLLRICFILTVSSLISTAQVPHFRDIAQAAGLTNTQKTSSDKRYIVESMSGGVGVFDCDNDGKLDIAVVNDSTVQQYRQGGDPMVALYHQDSNLKFSNITQSAGLTRRGWAMGMAVADYDNDGNLDLYVTGFGGSVLYRGLGTCKFEDATQRAGVGVTGFSTGAAWGDYDRDGKVDLFVARYVHLDINKLPEFGSNEKFCRYKTILVQCGPWGMEGETDFLFHNRGDGTFEEVSKKAGVADPDKRYGLGAMWGDYDNDGWPDLYVANDAGANYLYRNQHDGTFKEDGMLSGAALGSEGQELGSMGVDWGDYDRDGRLDITVTNFSEQANNLYHSGGVEGFTDQIWSSKMGQATYPMVGWGTGFVDFDNDGLADIFVANGHVYPQVDSIPGGVKYRQPLLLFRNKGDSTFEDISIASGLAALPLASRRGAAFADLNDDGNVDVVVFNMGEAPSLLLQDVANRNHRAQFRLIGAKSNRAAIGTRVVIRTGKQSQMQEVRGGASYLSQNDLRLHFGLGEAATMDAVEITWPTGKQETLRGVAADAVYTITEGQGITGKAPLLAPSPAALRPASESAK